MYVYEKNVSFYRHTMLTVEYKNKKKVTIYYQYVIHLLCMGGNYKLNEHKCNKIEDILMLCIQRTISEE